MLPVERAKYKTLEAKQQPQWPDLDELNKVRQRLSTMPPLVFAGEARQLRDQLGKAANGEAFLLQAGDCAESFHDFTGPNIRNKLKVILQMALILTYSAGLPIVKVGRMAGQFAKPRSAPFENINGMQLPSFRGHIINDDNTDEAARRPSPSRMIEAYNQSAATLNLIRAFTTGGFADLNMVHHWNLEFVASSPEGRAYEELAKEIERALSFMTAIGLNYEADTPLHQVDFFTSHEALLLDYEDPLTRADSTTGDWYDCSAHMLWVGERTRQLDGAHIEFLSEVNNPIGCKIGPSTTSDEILKISEKLNPKQMPGRLTLISRMGVNNVEKTLPDLMETIRDEGHSVLWICDPMHGNTKTSSTGKKTRDFGDISAEIEGFFKVARDLDVWPGGIHIELTGDDVTECTGGSNSLTEQQLDTRYETVCDPRLNARQSIDLAFFVSKLLSHTNKNGHKHD